METKNTISKETIEKLIADVRDYLRQYCNFNRVEVVRLDSLVNLIEEIIEGRLHIKIGSTEGEAEEPARKESPPPAKPPLEELFEEFERAVLNSSILKLRLTKILFYAELKETK